MTWEGLSPPYRTIVADPPWHYDAQWHGGIRTDGVRDHDRKASFHYSTMSLSEIAALDVASIAAENAHLYLWTTNRYLHNAFHVLEDWGFQYSQTLTWCKTPHGIGPGGAFSSTTEWVLFARRGSLPPLQRVDSTWWHWTRTPHSVKPSGFLDVVETVSPGPYVELFARQPRLGWDAWGWGYEETA